MSLKHFYLVKSGVSMGAFQYQALKKSGSSCKGVLEADSERHARQLLREQGLIPSQINLLKKNKSSKTAKKIKGQDLSLFTRQLATLLSASLPVEEALKGVAEQTENNKIRELIIALRAKVLEGYSLAQALNEYPDSFSDLYKATINAGEHTGNLDVVLEELAQYIEHQQQTKQKVQQALIYPGLMIFVSICIVSFLLQFVVPKIIDVFSSSNQNLPFITTVLIKCSDLFKTFGIYIFSLFILSVFIIKKSLAFPKFKYNWHKLLLKFPLISYLIQSINVARYFHTFSILFKAGVNVLDAMKVSSSLINNQVMRVNFDKALVRVKEGVAINQSLKETQFLSPMSLHLIASGEKSAKLSEMMQRCAFHLDNEVKRLIDTGLTLLEPLIILCMGGVVLFIVLAILLPIFSMEQIQL